ncbi:hypothetical protein WJX72_004792 [[Myrmecia] bisecta]|uniref:U-box domain-containing protein n=1 Tax=[Myrmecia] bisecta TaxID=41462 RepID=A0AAW1PLM5_9CHLO
MRTGQYEEPRVVFYESEMEENLCCPITQDLFVDPVMAGDCNTYNEYKEKGWQYWSGPTLQVLEAEADVGDFERIQGNSRKERILPKCIQVLKMLRDMEKGPEPTRTAGAHAFLDAFKDSPLLGESRRKRIKAHLTEMAPMREKLLREEAMMAEAPDEPEEAGTKASAEDRERRSNKAKEAKSKKEAEQAEEAREREAERLRAEEADAKQHEYDALLVKRAEAAHSHARAVQDEAWKQNLWPESNGVHLEDVGKEEECETQRARRAHSKQAGSPSRRPQPAGRAGNVPAYMHPGSAQQGQAYRPGPACYQPLGAPATPTDEEFDKLMSILSSESAASNPAVVGAQEGPGALLQAEVALLQAELEAEASAAALLREEEEKEAGHKAAQSKKKAKRKHKKGKQPAESADAAPSRNDQQPAPSGRATATAATDSHFGSGSTESMEAWHARLYVSEMECPITQVIMTDPVIAADGHTYERAAVEAWFSRHDTGPMTNEVVAHKLLTPNIAMRRLIATYRAQQGAGQ